MTPSLSFERAWKVARDSLLLAIVRAALAITQAAVDALGLDEQGRRSVVVQLTAMLLPPPPAADGDPG
jgi:hypothetical protein